MSFISGLTAYASARLASGWVAFPNLFGSKGLKLPINDTAFKVGSFEVKWYGLIICAAFILCVVLGLRSCEKYGIKQDDLLDYVLFAIPSALIGARVYYVIFNFDNYRDNLMSVFNYWEGGLAIYGGVIAALLAVFFVSLYKKQSFVNVAGFGAVYIILGQAIGRWGNFFNQEAFGGPTDLPWGMNGDRIEEFVLQQVRNGVEGYSIGTLVHPTFLYESLWCFLVFVFLLIYRKKWAKSNGECLSLYMILYGLERVLVEGLRTDSLYIGHTNVRVSQLLSGILIVAGIALFIDLRHKWKDSQYEVAEGEGSLAAVVERMKDQENAEAEAAPDAGSDTAADTAPDAGSDTAPDAADDTDSNSYED